MASSRRSLKRKTPIHHGLLRFIKDASLAPFLDVAFKLFLRDSRLFGDIDVETLIPRLVEALSSLVIGRITRDKFFIIGEYLVTVSSGLLIAIRLGISSPITMEK